MSPEQRFPDKLDHLPSARQLSVAAHRAGDAGEVEVLALTGEIDITNGPRMRAEVYRCLEERPAVLVVDLSAVTFLGAAGLHVLVDADEAATGHTVLRVAASHRTVLHPIRITALDQVLTVFATLEDAVAGTDRVGRS
jgi:anti-sigma B factor antagonist